MSEPLLGDLLCGHQPTVMGQGLENLRVLGHVACFGSRQSVVRSTCRKPISLGVPAMVVLVLGNPAIP
jgi:hypothetical protein